LLLCPQPAPARTCPGVHSILPAAWATYVQYSKTTGISSMYLVIAIDLGFTPVTYLRK